MNSELVKEIKQSISEIASRGGIKSEKAFSAWYAINFFDIDEDAAIEAASIDGSEDQGIDFLFIDHQNERIIMLQAHLPQKHDKPTPITKFNSITTAIPLLDSPDIFKKAGRNDIYKIAEEILDKKEDYECVAGTISLGLKSSEIERAVEGINQSSKLSPYRFFYEHLESIESGYQSIKDSEEGVPEDIISFNGESFLSDAGEYGKSWIGSLSGDEISRLYNIHRDRIFAQNVRLFLGTRKGGINEQIVNTAKNNPGKFWALNNGITLVADTVTQIDGEKGKLKITRFSIVNGCQTTVSIWKAGGPPNVKVLTRIVAANKLVIGDIIRYNNTQNAVRIWTVRASDTIQNKLRSEFEKFDIEYAPKPSSKRNKKPETEAIYLDRLAQYLASKTDLLIEAVKEKSELFDRYYQDIFHHGISSEEVYLSWLMGIFADKMRQERLLSIKSEDTDKISSEILGVSGTYWIIHCSYAIFSSINKEPLKIKIEHMKTDVFRNTIKKYLNQGLEFYFDLSVDSYDSADYNSVRQALRSQKFMSKINTKLSNKIAKIKEQKKSHLPFIEDVVKSIPKNK